MQQKTCPNEGFSYSLPLLQARRTKNAFARPREEERGDRERRRGDSAAEGPIGVPPSAVFALDWGKEEAKSAARRREVSSLKNKR